MTLAELFSAIQNGGWLTAFVLLSIPALVAGIAWGLENTKRQRASQIAANFGIALGFAGLLVELCVLIFVWTEDRASIADLSVFLLLAPVYLVVAGFIVENLIHPGRQEQIRAQIRSGLLIVIVLAVLYFVLSRLRMHMVIWTGIFGFILFIAAIIGILYLLVKKFV